MKNSTDKINVILFFVSIVFLSCSTTKAMLGTDSANSNEKPLFVRAGDFTKFRENALPWYKLTSAERYKEVTQAKIILPALRWTGGRAEALSRPPSIDEFKLTDIGDKTSKTFIALNLHGSYEASGKSLKFEIQYNAVGKEWKINVINLNTSFRN